MIRHILGQSNAIDLLQTALAQGHLHHAFIFHGPSGTGKFTTALAFSQILLCHQPQRNLTGYLEACGQCDSCLTYPSSSSNFDADKQPQTSTHPDLHIIKKELARYSDDRQVRQRKLLNIPVDVLEKYLLEPVYRAPQWGHQKVFIVDESELLDPIGQNKLLKTLEEPPPQTYIILITPQEDKLLATVRSRCHRIAFSPLSDQAVADWLNQHAADIDPQTRGQLAALAQGSIGLAKLAIDYDLLPWQQQMTQAMDAMSSGQYLPDLGSQLAQLIGAFAEAWVKKHENASKEAANQQAATLMWSLICQHASEKLAHIAKECDMQTLDLGESEARLRPWMSVIDAAGQAQRELAAHVNLTLVTDHLVSMLYRALTRDTYLPTAVR